MKMALKTISAVIFGSRAWKNDDQSWTWPFEESRSNCWGDKWFSFSYLMKLPCNRSW